MQNKPPRTYRWIGFGVVFVLGSTTLPWLATRSSAVSGRPLPWSAVFSSALSSGFSSRGAAQPAQGSRGQFAVATDAPPVITVGSGNGGYLAVAGELLVRARSGVTASAMVALAQQLGSEVLEQGVRSGLYRLKIPRGTDPESFQRMLSFSPAVDEVRPNAVAEATDCSSGEHREQQWNLDLIEEPLACASYNPALSSIVVAVLDTGVAYEDYDDGEQQYRVAPDLSSTLFIPGYDFVHGDEHPNDDHQHGTHIASIIGAQGGISGVAPGVQLLPVKVLGSNKQGNELDIVEGLYYAVDHGADVINMSLAFGPGYFPSSSLQQAISYAVDHGVVLVASAGNEGDWGIRYPAAFPDVIAVGAARLARSSGGLTARLAAYSEKGYPLDLVAPGGMLKTDLNRDGYPDGVLAQSIELNTPDAFGYYYYAGTSQAAAHVSGAAAWLLADGALPEDVGAVLSDSALGMNREGFDPATGTGLVQLEEARLLAQSEERGDASQYHVNLLPRLEAGSGGGVRAVVRIEVIDAEGVPVPHVRVGGSWFGSIVGFNATARTGADGVAEVRSQELPGAQGVAVGFQVERLLEPGRVRTGTPFQYYSLSPASAEVYARMLADPVVSRSLVLYKLDPSDESLDPLLDRSSLITSYVMKPVGAGMRSGPLAIVFDSSFAPEVTQAASAQVTPLSWDFPSPLYSGWGMVDHVEGLLVDVSSSRLGPAPRYLILRFDPAMASVDPEHCYPVLNAYPSVFLEANRVFGNGFASSTLGDGFASSTLGDGFASSTLGDGFASSTLGDGFASSTLGDSAAGTILSVAFIATGGETAEADVHASAMSSGEDGAAIALDEFDPYASELITEEDEEGYEEDPDLDDELGSDGAEESAAP